MNKIATMSVENHADLRYKAALRTLEIQASKHGVTAELSAIVPQGPEALLTEIDDATNGQHCVSQELIEEVCNAYDALMHEVRKQLPNSETAN